VARVATISVSTPICHLYAQLKAQQMPKGKNNQGGFNLYVGNVKQMA
jgi:hypothetical protein